MPATRPTPPASRPAAPATPEPPYQGYATLSARSDTSSWFYVQIERGVECAADLADSDPLVTLVVDRRMAKLFGDPRQEFQDRIEELRAGDLEALIAALQAAVTVARRLGVIPAAPADYRAHLQGRMRAFTASGQR